MEQQYILAPRPVSLSYMMGNTLGLLVNSLMACIVFQSMLFTLAISLLSGIFATFSGHLYVDSIDGTTTKFHEVDFRGVVYYGVLVLACRFVIDYYGSMRNTMLLKFAFKILNLKTEY